MGQTKTLVILYAPVIHRGVIEFLKQVTGFEGVYLIDPLECGIYDRPRDLHALPVAVNISFLRQYFPGWKIVELTPARCASLRECPGNLQLAITMPDDEVMRSFAVRYLTPTCSVTWLSAFIRYDRKNTASEEKVDASRIISHQELDREMMAIAKQEASKSPDWWRQVGAVLSCSGQDKLVLGFNGHVPSDYRAYIDGDPASNFNWGEEKPCVAIHAEAAVIAEAASRGFSTLGAHLYVTTFPCPTCARLVAAADIQRVYYVEGYSLNDAWQVFQSKGIEIVKVE